MDLSLTAPLEQAESRRGFRIVLAGLMLIMGLAALDQNIVNTALPRIVESLGGASELSWVVSAFLLTSTLAMPLYGKLADTVDRRRLLVWAVCLFLLASAACGEARSMPQLIAFRAVQGLGGGGLITLAFVIVGDLVSPSERPRYQGLFVAIFGLSSLIGPVVGGALTTLLSWRWVFFVNLPIGGAALVLLLMGLRLDTDRSRKPIDYPGAILLCIATPLILLALNLAARLQHDASTKGLMVAAVLTSAAFVWRQLTAAEPILDLRLFKVRAIAIANVTTFVAGFSMMSALVFLPVYLQFVRGETAFRASLVITPQVFGLVVAGIVGGRVISKVRRLRPFLIGGAGLAGASLGLLAAAVTFSAPIGAIALTMTSLGLGVGLVMPNTVTLAQNAVDAGRIGEVTGAINFFRSLGFASGVALSGGVVSLQLASVSGLPHQLVGEAYRHGIATSFSLAAVLLTATFALIFALPDDRLRGGEPLRAERSEREDDAEDFSRIRPLVATETPPISRI